MTPPTQHNSPRRTTGSAGRGIAWLVLAWMLGLSRLPGATPPSTLNDPICGPEILTVADAWVKLGREFDFLESSTATWEPALISPRLEASKAHLHFIRNRSALLTESSRSSMQAAVEKWLTTLAELDPVAVRRDPKVITSILARCRVLQATIKGCYPTTALDPNAPEALTMTGLPAPSIQIRVLTAALHPDKPTQIRFRLVRPNGKPVLASELVVHQERLIHAFLLDPSFTDFHHEHPRETTTPGEYEFTFIPTKASNYRLWLNIISQPFELEEFPYTDLLPERAEADPRRSSESIATNDTERVQLAWISGPPQAARKASVQMTFTRPDGTPLRSLEPYLGSFAHLIGFSEDYRTVVHVHPSMVPSVTARGGPTLDFQFIVPKAGFMRLFVQTQIAGNLQLASFGLQAAPP